MAFVSELQLGFGHTAASNIGQRFAEVIKHIFQREFQARLVPFEAAQPDGPIKRWLERRRALPTPESGTQHARAHTAMIYTDDMMCMCIGSERTLLMLRTWIWTINMVATKMADPIKRQLGCSALAWGAKLYSNLGVAVTTQDKLIKTKTWL